VCDVSQQWLLNYIKELYSNLPNDLKADLRLPDIESYLADRIDEEKRVTWFDRKIYFNKSGRRSSVRLIDCSNRQSLIFLSCPESKTSGTFQPSKSAGRV
jgi:hypothetical protein